MIISLHDSIPIKVFALVVSCGVSATLDVCGVDLNIRDTNVNDDDP